MTSCTAPFVSDRQWYMQNGQQLNPCFMAHRPAPSRNCSEFRTMQFGLCSRSRGDPMPSRYCTSCIVYQSSIGSHASWQFSGTKFWARPLRFTCTAESQNVPAAELYVHLPSRCTLQHFHFPREGKFPLLPLHAGAHEGSLCYSYFHETSSKWVKVWDQHSKRPSLEA